MRITMTMVLPLLVVALLTGPVFGQWSTKVTVASRSAQIAHLANANPWEANRVKVVERPVAVAPVPAPRPSNDLRAAVERLNRIRSQRKETSLPPVKAQSEILDEWLERNDFRSVDQNKGRRGTVLHVAVSMGDRQAATMLLAAGADINARNRFDRTPLHEACMCGQPDIVQFLIDKGADVEARDSLHETALQKASRLGNQRIASILLDGRAQVDARDDSGKTALHVASQSGYRQIVELLVSNGADANIRDAAGATALQVAMSSGYKDIARVLVR